MNTIIYRQAAENLTTESVSIEPDGTSWTGLDADRTYLDTALVQAEYERLEALAATTEANRVIALQAARTFALSLGFTEAMLAVMYPQLTEAPSE